MDIVKEVNGYKHTFCLPASQYVAGLIKRELHDEYEIEVELTGTGATLKKYSKRKYVDFHDKEHISYLKTSRPPIFIGGFYWEGDKDLAVFYKTCTDAENEKLKKEGVLLIPYDVFIHLRDQDLIEFIGSDVDKTGKEVKVKFKATKEFVKEYAKIEHVPDDMPWYKIPKEKFSRKFLENSPKKTARKKWKPKKSGG